ncbi:MAG: hypothetical protein JO248_08235, partial [Acidimicrobiia bacterium]|nr:hypothetical protein [Acidimicrobiia bacterium]
MGVNALLPPEFAELEEFAERWCLPTETERFARRMASDMDDLGAFYAAFSPRLEEAIEFCDRHLLDALPDDVDRLLQLIHSFVMVSMAVEIFHQPKIVDAA